MEGQKETVENSIPQTSQYNVYSNPTYLKKERKSNLFIASALDYFAFGLPATVGLFLLFNRLFRCLFNYELSILFRPYSFWWTLFEILAQGNVQFFTFLAFRNFLTPFSLDLPSKLLQVLTVLIFFIVLMATFASYSHYYTKYGKLAKYFLANMFRFKSSYALMTIAYGVRPFLKGVVHALLYNNWVVQMWVLVGVEILILVIILVFEFNFDSHRSKPVFMMDILYYSALVVLDLLFLMKYEYFKKDQEAKELLEGLITILVYFMIGLLIAKLAWEYFPFKFIYHKLCSENN